MTCDDTQLYIHLKLNNTSPFNLRLEYALTSSSALELPTEPLGCVKSVFSFKHRCKSNFMQSLFMTQFTMFFSFY